MVAVMDNPTFVKRRGKDLSELRSWLSGLLTQADLCRLFRRGELTILKWRNRDGLPFITIPGEGRNAIRYDRDEVVQWARAKGKRLYLSESGKILHPDVEVD